MLKILVRKELLHHLHSLRFAVACLVCCAAVVTSFYVRAHWFEQAAENYRTNQALYHSEVEEKRNLNALGVRVDKPLNPMHVFSSGADRSLTSTALVSSHEEPFIEISFQENPVIALFPVIDLVFFIGSIMSLLAIVFSHDAICGEREQGTLKLLMSYSVPRDTVLLAKWLGGYLTMMLPFAAAVLVGLATATLGLRLELGAGEWLGLAILLAAAAVYIAGVYSLGMMVSARASSSATSIVVMLFAWVACVLVIPNLVPYVVKEAVEPMPRYALDKRKRQAEARELERWAAEDQRWGEDHAHLDERERRVEFDLRNRDHYLRVSQAQKKSQDLFLNEMEEQIELTQWISRLSPASSFSFVATELTGTSVREWRRFVESLWHYRDEITRYVYDHERGGWNFAAGHYNTEGYPRYRLALPPMGDRVQAAVVDLVLLLLWCAALYVAAHFTFLRCDVK